MFAAADKASGKFDMNTPTMKAALIPSSDPARMPMYKDSGIPSNRILRILAVEDMLFITRSRLPSQ